MTITILPAVTGAMAIAWPLLGRHVLDAGSAEWELPLAIAAVVLALQVGIGGVTSWWTEVFRTGFRVDMQSRVLRRLLQQPLRDRDRDASGWNVLEDAAALESVFTDALPALGTCALQMATVLVVLAAWDPLVALVALVGLPITVLVAMLGGRSLRHHNQRIAERAGAQMTQLVDTLDAGLLVRLAGAEDREANAFRREADELRHEQLALTRRGMWFALRDRIVTHGLVLGLAAFVVARSIDGPLTLGQLVATLVMLAIVSGPLARLASLIRRLQPALAAHDRLRDLLEPAADDAVSGGQPLPEGPLTLAVENLCFAWRFDQPVLADVTLTIQPGRITGLSGPTGAGKSTLALLLTGLLPPTSGRVTVNGADLAGFDAAAVRRAITLVPQRDPLVGRTLRDALTFQAPDATDEDIQRVLTELGADSLVEARPGGLATRLRDRGGELSGGQRQLLAIGRALLARPRVLILDEATAALDEAAEARVMATIRRRLMPDGTVLLISHRSSALAATDERMRLDPTTRQ